MEKTRAQLLEAEREAQTTVIKRLEDLNGSLATAARGKSKELEEALSKQRVASAASVEAAERASEREGEIARLLLLSNSQAAALKEAKQDAAAARGKSEELDRKSVV